MTTAKPLAEAKLQSQWLQASPFVPVRRLRCFPDAVFTEKRVHHIAGWHLTERNVKFVASVKLFYPCQVRQLNTSPSSLQTVPSVVMDQSFREVFAASSFKSHSHFPLQQRVLGCFICWSKALSFHHASGKLNACGCSALYPKALILGPRTAQLPE